MIEIALDADPEWESSGADWSALAEAAVHAAIRESDLEGLLTTSRTVEVSIHLTDDETVQRLNAEWRGKDKPTNVLSFPMLDEEQLAASVEGGPMLLLGDMALAHETCAREAKDKGIATDIHATHLLVHGMLHLLGYDHLEEAGAEDMEAREVRALARLGISNPYAHDTEHC